MTNDITTRAQVLVLGAAFMIALATSWRWLRRPTGPVLATLPRPEFTHRFSRTKRLLLAIALIPATLGPLAAVLIFDELTVGVVVGASFAVSFRRKTTLLREMGLQWRTGTELSWKDIATAEWEGDMLSAVTRRKQALAWVVPADLVPVVVATIDRGLNSRHAPPRIASIWTSSHE